jgi:hypothetical protein
MQNESTFAVSPLAAELLRHMEHLSEFYYSAGWLSDLDHVLWAHVIEAAGVRAEDGYNELPDGEVKMLRRLAFAAGGWWVWRETNAAFVDLPTWLAQYDHRKAMIWT